MIMKQRPILLCTALLVLTTLKSFSQESKADFFKAHSSLVKCSIGEINKAFSEEKGRSIELQFSEDFKIKGTLISNKIKNQNVQAATIKLLDFKNTICHFSKIIKADKSIAYRGMIIDYFSNDCYMLESDGNNIYQFKKVNREELIPTCTL